MSGKDIVSGLIDIAVGYEAGEFVSKELGGVIDDVFDLF